MKLKKKISNLSVNIFLLLFSVLLFFLANPNPVFNKGVGFIAWIYYLPILLLLRKTSLKSSWIYGFFFGLFFYLSFAYWLYNYGLICLLFICIMYGLFYSIFFTVLKLAIKEKINFNWILAFFIITSFEFLKTKGFLGFSYGMTAYTQWRYTDFIQIAQYVGAEGINCLVIFNSCLIYSFIDKAKTKKEYFDALDKNTQINQYESHLHFLNEHEKRLKLYSFFPNICSFVVFIFIIMLGFVVSSKTAKKSYDYVKIAAIQHNENPQASGLDSDIENFNTLKSLTDSALELNDDVQIVVWPETAVVTTIPYNYYQGLKQETKNSLFINNVLNYIDKKNVTFVIGNNGLTFDVNTGEKKSYSNNVLVFDGAKNVIPPVPYVYKKIKLVPFTEGFKFANVFPNFTKKIESLFGPMYEYGQEYKVFNKGNLYFSTPICFEDTFSSVCRKMYLNGARCFINLSNDSWSKSRSCQYQHLSMAVFRSIENKVPSVRSTSSGITCMINERGKVVFSAQEFVKSFICVDVPVISANEKPTFYASKGYLIEYVIIFTTLIMLIIQIITVIIKITIIKGAKNGKK